MVHRYTHPGPSDEGRPPPRVFDPRHQPLARRPLHGHIPAFLPRTRTTAAHAGGCRRLRPWEPTGRCQLVRATDHALPAAPPFPSKAARPVVRPDPPAVRFRLRLGPTWKLLPLFPGPIGDRAGAHGDEKPPYRTNEGDQAAIVEHDKAQLDGWTLLREESFPNGRTATFVRGDAYFQVSARGTADAGEGPFRVDARDARAAPWIRKLVHAPSS